MAFLQHGKRKEGSPGMDGSRHTREWSSRVATTTPLATWRWEASAAARCVFLTCKLGMLISCVFSQDEDEDLERVALEWGTNSSTYSSYTNENGELGMDKVWLNTNNM